MPLVRPSCGERHGTRRKGRAEVELAGKQEQGDQAYIHSPKWDSVGSQGSPRQNNWAARRGRREDSSGSSRQAVPQRGRELELNTIPWERNSLSKACIET